MNTELPVGVFRVPTQEVWDEMCRVYGFDKFDRYEKTYRWSPKTHYSSVGMCVQIVYGKYSGIVSYDFGHATEAWYLGDGREVNDWVYGNPMVVELI